MLSSEERIRSVKSGLSEFDLRSLNLANFTTKEEVRFHEYIKDVCQRLLGDSINLDEKNIFFALSDKRGINAEHVPMGDATVIYITEGLLDLCQNEDQLAFILGHELGHYEEKLRQGAGKKNSKAEETACDLRAIQKMARGGYNLEEACSMAVRLFDERHISIEDLKDPHTNNGSRTNLINAMKKLERDRVIEEQNVEITYSTPVPKEIRSLVRDRIKRPSLSEVLLSQMRQICEKYANDESVSTEEFDDLVIKDVITEWLKAFHEHIIPYGRHYAMTEDDVRAFAACTDNFIYDVYDHFEDKFLAAVFADMEAMRGDEKMSACIDIMHDILQKIRIPIYSMHGKVDASEENSQTAVWLRRYLHGFREADGEKYDEIINNLEYVKNFVAKIRNNTSEGIYVKNFNILELDFNESDVGKKFSPRVLNYIRSNIDSNGQFVTFSGLQVSKMGDSLLLTHEDKKWNIFVDATGAIAYSFSAEDMALTQILSSKKIIENARVNVDAVASGQITDVRQRLAVLREAHKIIAPVYQKDDLSMITEFDGDKKLTYNDIITNLSPEAAQFFNERNSETTDNLPYTQKIIDLYAETIRNAPKEYFDEILTSLSKLKITHKLCGEDKLFRAFFDNPQFYEEVVKNIESYEAFPEKSIGWDERDFADMPKEEKDKRKRLQTIVTKLRDITDFKLKEHLEKGGNFDDFEQPFKEDFAKLFGFGPNGKYDDVIVLLNLKQTRRKDYRQITLYEQAYVAYSSYDALKSDNATDYELLLGYNSAGVGLVNRYDYFKKFFKSAEGIDDEERKQIQEKQQSQLAIINKIHGRLQQRIDWEIENGNIAPDDIFAMTLRNEYNEKGVHGTKGFETVISNRDLEKRILHNVENCVRNNMSSSILALKHLVDTYGNKRESDAYKEKIWPTVASLFERDDFSVMDKVTIFHNLVYYNIFASDYKHYYEILIGKDGKGGLLAEIEKLDDIMRFTCYQELLNKYTRIPDPEIRADVIKKAARSYWESVGMYNDITNKDEAARQFMINGVITIKNSYIAELDKIEILKELSELTMSQKELSLAMKPDEINIQVSDTNAVKAAYGLDVVAYAFQDYPETKVDIQDFLLGEGTLQDAQNLVKSIQISMCKEHDRHNSDKILDRYLKGEDVSDKFAYYSDRSYYNKLNPQSCLHFKKEFDAAPLEAKALIVNEIITNGKTGWEESFKIVSDKLFADAGELGKVGSDFLYSYISARPNSEKTFYLAAMMAAANNKSKSSSNYVNSPYTSEERNLAKGLRLFLENSGPAGTKLAQAMASYSEVPEFIRYEMQFAKSEANPPARWEIFSGNDETMDKLLSYGPLGKRRGSASFFVTYDLGDKIVKIMRRGAKLKADNEFAIYREMLDKLSAEYQNISSFKRLVQNAAENVYIETDMDVGEQQYKDAKKLYPEKVTADGITFDIKVMDWVARDKDWAIMEKAQGVDFKQLEEPYKTAVAKAVFSTELANMLSGKRFDFDRHGGQYKFDAQNNVIGVFDTGAMSMFEPSDKERQALGMVLARTLNGLRHNQDVATVFSREIDKVIREQYGFEISKNYPVPPYLSEFQRGMLALNDFYAGLSGKDMAECMIKAMDNGKHKIHPQIVRAFKLEIKKTLDSHNVSVKELLNPEKTDNLAPEARAGRRIGKILFDAAFKSLSEGKEINISSDDAQKIISRLGDRETDLQIVKGVVRGAYAKLNPNNHTKQDREDLGMFLYHVCQTDVKNQQLQKGEALDKVITEVAAKYPQMGKYTQDVMKLVSVMAKIPALNDNKLKKAAAFVTFADNDVARGFKKALSEDKSVGFAKRIMLKLTPMEFIPVNAKKMLIKSVSKHFVANYVSKKIFGTKDKVLQKLKSIDKRR